MTRLRTWAPFVLYLCLQLAVVVLLYLGVRPPLNAWLQALPDWLLPEGFFSYPAHLLLIPSLLYNRAMLPMGLFLESLLQAAATWIFLRYALAERLPGLRSAIAEVKFGYAQFVVLWLANYVLLRGSSELFNLAVGDLWLGFARRRAALDLVHVMTGAVFNSLLAYGTVVILMERTSLGATLIGALRAFGRHWLATCTTVFAGTLLSLPLARLLENAPDWISRFNPEVVLAVTGLSLLTGALASYWVSAVLTFWYLLHRTGT